MKRFHLLSAIAAGVLTSVSAFAEPALTLGTDLTGKETSAAKKSTTLKISPTLLGRNLEDRYVNSKWAGGQLDIVGERKIGEIFSAKLDMSVLMTAGQFTSQYSEEGKAPNAVMLNEAYATLKPFGFFSFDAGVIATSFSALPSTFEASGFPSLRETIQFQGDTMKVSTFAMQSIPASDTRTVQPTENGVTTTMSAVGLGFSPSDSYKGALSLEAGLTRFQFNNLNSSAATDSQYMGNTVVAPGPQAKFVYEFAGYEYGVGGNLRLTTNTSLHGSAAFLKNEQAPEGANKAYTYSGGIAFPTFGLITDLTGGYFYNESDTLPASYSTVGRGHNNRYGQFAKIKIENKNESVSGSLKYTRANEIEDMPYSADRDILFFTVEMAYDVL